MFKFKTIFRTGFDFLKAFKVYEQVCIFMFLMETTTPQKTVNLDAPPSRFLTKVLKDRFYPLNSNPDL